MQDDKLTKLSEQVKIKEKLYILSRNCAIFMFIISTLLFYFAGSASQNVPESQNGNTSVIAVMALISLIAAAFLVLITINIFMHKDTISRLCELLAHVGVPTDDRGFLDYRELMQKVDKEMANKLNIKEYMDTVELVKNASGYLIKFTNNEVFILPSVPAEPYSGGR